MALDKASAILEREQVIERSYSLRRSGPDRVKNCMEKLAALGGGKADFSRFAILRPESCGCKRLEWTLGLCREDARSALKTPLPKWNATEIGEDDCRRWLNGGRRKFSRHRSRRPGNLRDEP